MMVEKAVARVYKHGSSGSAEFIAWSRMKSRCFNPKDKSFINYGERGITVCKRWRNSFNNFIEDMGKKPSPDLSIERIDNDGNYDPSNCRWATRREQSLNQRRNRYITFKGIKKTVSQWHEATGINDGTIRYRLKHGWATEDILSRDAQAEFVTLMQG